jgi:nicotinamidase-related amidase
MLREFVHAIVTRTPSNEALTLNGPSTTFALWCRFCVPDVCFREAVIAISEPKDLPSSSFFFEGDRAALVVIDPQNDFLSDSGAGWPVFGASVTENNVVANLAKLFEAAKSRDMTVAVSPHYEYPSDGKWIFGGPGEELISQLHMFERSGPLTVEGFPGSGADFLEGLKPYVLGGSTIVASPHKMWGPESNDLALQLRKRGVSQIILAGMAANLCVESHLRHLLEEGFEIAVVGDATASARVPAGDGYLAALTNYSFLAHAVWSTDTAVAHIHGDI